MTGGGEERAEEEQRTRDLGTEVAPQGGAGGGEQKRRGGRVPSRNVAPRSVQGRQAKKGRHGIGKTKNSPQRKP